MTPSFYRSVLLTILRCLKGYLLSLGLAYLMAMLSYRSKLLQALFRPLIIVTEAIPNISYIILALIWLGAEGAVSLVVFMILFPIFYSGFYNGFEQIDSSVKEVTQLYPETWWNEFRYYYFPYSKSVFLTTGKTAMNMALKVGVMAEILGQVRNGIGKSMYLAKINLDTTGIFAYTIVIIVFSLLLSKLFDIAYRALLKKEERI